MNARFVLTSLVALCACGGASQNFGADTAHCTGPRSASYSAPDGGERVEILCTGPAGCWEQDGRVDCDLSSVAPHDPCAPTNTGVAVCLSNTIILVCDGETYVPEGCRSCLDDGASVTCHNPNGCKQDVTGNWICK